MKLAFCLFRYFPFGGLQRDFLRIARLCLQRGHSVDVYTMSWEGEREPSLNIEIIPVTGWQNHTRSHSYSQQVQKKLTQKPYDCIVGFNKMPGLDIYYAADVCYQKRIQAQRPFWYRFLPRYHQYLRDERSVFTPISPTKILILSAMQGSEYRNCYQTPLERFQLLPPGIARDRIAPENAAAIRHALRLSHGIKENENILLTVGSGFKTKGLDRTLHALAALPAELKNKTHLWVIGQDNPDTFLNLAKQLHITHRVNFLGGRHDVANYLLAADLLMHPSYHENTGTVILEAMVAGLPVLTVDVCGYAHYVRDANAGKVLSAPFHQDAFNHTLQDMLLSPERSLWHENGLAFAKSADIYSLPEKAVAVIEGLQNHVIPAQTGIHFANGMESANSKIDSRLRGNDNAALSFHDFMNLRGESYREQNGRRTHRVMLNNKPYFIKQHFGVGWKEILKNLVQFKLPILSAKNEWQAILRLQELAIATPTVTAYGCRGLNPARLQSFILMEECAPVISLEDYCRNWKTSPPLFSLKLALIRRIAHIAKTMHENGINHRDFYICHFLLKISESSQAGFDLFLIDLHRAGIHHKLRPRWIIKDLAGLYFSSKECGLTRRDYWRFMKLYRQKSLRDIITTEADFWKKTKDRGDTLYDAHAVSD